ncbi:hypothetical protein CRP01_05305 [Flavilitoribacter nigricans DSM 23189 = NBRC 102662]|uniref:SGNH hydrolase-type esterase domain-containing protein n=2 Tax=Flavilitoribacter TaxID=2762562 RepID=A0A2D0NH70_FLAN2|nr:hypothetical protein CRP01_05305 [Flavilitoribacter nigricans DSM 23189 = NBRC 102662]
MTAVFLLLYPLLHRQSGVLSQHFRNYNFFQRFLQDSSEMTVDTLQVDTSVVVKDTVKAPPPPPPPPAYAGKAGLETFYDALRSGKGQIRVAYFGDSAIEGDLICQTLRDSLQQRFGGSGVGLVPISSPIRGFRRSIRHNTSTNWYRRMLGQKNWPGYPLGILGGYFLAGKPPQAEDSLTVDSTLLNKDSLLIAEEPEDDPSEEEDFWVTYRGVNLFSGLRMVPRARLFYSAPIPDSTGHTAPSGSLDIAAGDRKAHFELNGKATVNQLWLLDSTVRQLSLTFDVPYSQPLFGISLESSQGVIVDNIPSRGNSGGRLLQVPYYRYNNFDSLLDYELVILQFGLNALAPELEDFSWYKSEINRTVRHIKQSFPNASILLIGPTDRGIKEEAEVVADPSVPLVTQVMREVAEQHKIGFFSFYEAMGGSGTIIDWADNKEPRWANLDYTHLSFPGAHAAGKMLLRYLLKDFDQQQ